MRFKKTLSVDGATARWWEEFHRGREKARFRYSITGLGEKKSCNWGARCSREGSGGLKKVNWKKKRGGDFFRHKEEREKPL